MKSLNEEIEQILRESFHKQFSKDMEDRLADPHSFMKLFDALKQMPWKDIQKIEFEFIQFTDVSKKSALETILRRHQRHTTNISKSKYMNGRTAA